MIGGGHIGNYSILSKVGQGTYGQIFVVQSDTTKELFAAKVEPQYVRHKTLAFEVETIKSLQTCDYFPKYVTSGSNAHFSYFIMALLGPSLATCLKRLPKHKFSASSALRVAFHTLKALEFLHRSGYIHRDIKPSNIVIRRDNKEYPIVLIDYGLARYYLHRQTGVHLPARPHPGFRGTVMYASVNAHMKRDLSRRDDLISWFYVIADIFVGELPWKHETHSVCEAKRACNMGQFISQVCPELEPIWDYISSLEFEEEPNYDMISQKLLDIMEILGVKLDDPYDWDTVKTGRWSSDPLDGITEQRHSSSYENSVSGSQSCCCVA